MTLCAQCLGGSFIQATTTILTISTFLPKPWQNDNLFQLVVQQRGGQNLRWTRFYPEKCFEIFAHFSFEIIFQVRVAPGEECCRRHRQTPSLWWRGRWRWSASWLRWAPPATKPPQNYFEPPSTQNFWDASSITRSSCSCLVGKKLKMMMMKIMMMMMMMMMMLYLHRRSVVLVMKKAEPSLQPFCILSNNQVQASRKWHTKSVFSPQKCSLKTKIEEYPLERLRSQEGLPKYKPTSAISTQIESLSVSPAEELRVDLIRSPPSPWE